MTTTNSTQPESATRLDPATSQPATTETAAAERDAAVRPSASPALLGGVGALTVALAVLALLGPDRAASDVSMMMSMGMTHYMELLSIHQPWNLLIFMALPVIVAETLAITEIALLYKPGQPAWVRTLNRVAGLLGGPIMLAIFLHLFARAVVPLTADGGWRGAADVIAVGCYLAGMIPLVGITMVELGLLGVTERDARRLRATFIAIFLVVAHIAMIFGMLNPGVLGYTMTH